MYIQELETKFNKLDRAYGGGKREMICQYFHTQR